LLRLLNARQYASQAIPFFGSWNRKAGRPDVWNFFVLQCMRSYYVSAMRKPTAGYSNAKGHHDSPFIRGLIILHDALPDDVRLRSSGCLRSRAAEMLKRNKTSLGRLLSYGDCDLRGDGDDLFDLRSLREHIQGAGEGGRSWLNHQLAGVVAERSGGSQRD
jgi:hypothetical protein